MLPLSLALISKAVSSLPAAVPNTDVCQASDSQSSLPLLVQRCPRGECLTCRERGPCLSCKHCGCGRTLLSLPPHSMCSPAANPTVRQCLCASFQHCCYTFWEPATQDPCSCPPAASEGQCWIGHHATEHCADFTPCSGSLPACFKL